MKYKKSTSASASTNQPAALVFLITILITSLVILAAGVFTLIMDSNILGQFNFLKNCVIKNKQSQGDPGAAIFNSTAQDYYSNLFSISFYQSIVFIVIGALLLLYCIFKFFSAKRLGIMVLSIIDYLVVIILVFIAMGFAITSVTFAIIAWNATFDPSIFANSNQFAIFKDGTALGDGFDKLYTYLNWLYGLVVTYFVVGGIALIAIIVLITMTILVIKGRITSIGIQLMPSKEMIKQNLLLGYTPKLGGGSTRPRIAAGTRNKISGKIAMKTPKLGHNAAKKSKVNVKKK